MLFRPDTSKIYVAVGYGFFVEFTHAEALKFIEKKTNQLTEYLLLMKCPYLFIVCHEMFINN